MRENFSIIVPIFNEKDNILVLIKQINSALKNYLFEIIIVDDCSSDGTQKIFTKKIDNCIFFRHKKNIGQSEAIRTGILIAKYNNIITIDGDLQNDPIDIPKLINAYSASNNLFLIGGIRSKRKDSYIKIISSKLANFFRQLILKDGCTDTGCGLKIFDKHIFLSIPFFNGIHRFLPALFKGFGYKTFFIEVTHRERFAGDSKYGTFDRLFKGIKDIYRVKKIINLKKEI